MQQLEVKMQQLEVKMQQLEVKMQQLYYEKGVELSMQLSLTLR